VKLKGCRIALAATALLLSVSALRAQEPSAPSRPVDSREWKRIKKLLPKHLWLPPGAQRRKSKIDARWRDGGYDRVRLTREQFAELAQILRNGSPYTKEKRRSATLEIATGESLPDGKEERMPVRIAVTSKYKPGCGRSFPLVITCHGGPMGELRAAQSAASTQFKLWAGFSGTLECIVAAPALTGERTGPREWTFLRNLIDDLDRRYNVDRDRILLTGHSWGGILTWHLGPAHADTFSLLAPFVCAVNPGREHLMNCRALPIYHVQGKRDIQWILKTGRERRKLLDELGYEHVYREMPGGHVSFGGEVAKIAKLFAKRRRALYAPEIVRRPARGGSDDSPLWYWIRCEERSFRASFDRKSRMVDVDIAGSFEVFLSDEMFDLEGPLTIRRDEEVVWQGKVERRLRFALAHVRATGDRGRVFAASVKVAPAPWR
jgi:pimeloyl-ACP methyl ester carboxylesterase